MKVIETKIKGLLIIEPTVFKDDRGFFLESYNLKAFKDNKIGVDFVQDNHSKSVKNTLRGLHSQNPNAQSKLVRVVRGSVYDVAVDVRKGSETFGQYVGVELTEDNFRQFFIPQGFLHGFCVLSEIAEVQYKCDNFYSPTDEITVRWDDSEIGIDWPVENPILSQRDAKAMTLKEAIDRL